MQDILDKIILFKETDPTTFWVTIGIIALILFWLLFSGKKKNSSEGMSSSDWNIFKKSRGL